MSESKSTAPFDKTNLPPLLAYTSGYMLPNPEGTTAACVAPIAIEWPYPTNWGKPEGATMPVPQGGWITCLGKQDSYYNAEFAETCSLTGKVLDPATDERAAELDQVWRSKGLAVLIVESRKTVGVEVLGRPANEAIGAELLTAEGPVVINADDVIVRNPRSGYVWRITPANREKRYLNNGELFQGTLPEEYR